MFTDKISIQVTAGNGGHGIVSWRREKYVPKGGPAGGNGGRGGDVIFVANENIFDLDAFRHIRIIKAQNGQSGGSQRKRGANGEDLIIKVPLGTLLKDKATGEVLFDFTYHEQKQIVCKGGFGGRGNACFATPTNRAPNKATNGRPGTEALIELELKMIADVGLVGFPNAGKSTLLTQVTTAKIKTASYPFTTLRPNLGYIKTYPHERGILLADIPGIIKGASDNKGLGLEFLRHIQRTQLLVFMVDLSAIDDRDPFQDLLTLRDELNKYDKSLLEKPSIVILNKLDTDEAQENKVGFHKQLKEHNITAPNFEICAITKEGLPEVVAHLKQSLQIARLHPETTV
ncbi:GTPase Obg [Chlamydiales bacterium SCGC AB-751-O23]|jgi:GTPase|nr:GTPase Obg [Chlamydiales bacterium SCGC AB-751-O23]